MISMLKTRFGIWLILLAALSGCVTLSASAKHRATSENGWKPLPDNVSNNSLDNLETFRGLLRLGHETHSFSPCGEKKEYWVVDRTNGDLADLYEELTRKPYEPIFVEVHGFVGRKPKDGFGADHDASLVVLEVVHASRLEDAWACREKYAEFAWKVQCNEPGMMVVVIPDSVTSYSMDGTFAFTRFSHRIRNEVVEMAASNGGHSLRLRIRPERCRDTMVDEIFGWSAEVKFDGRVLHGCARKGDLSMPEE